MNRQNLLEDWRHLGSRQVAVNGIELQVTEHGEGPLVVFCHGFPELGFSWRHQVFALAEAGFRTLTPDMRGYGGSSRPDRIEDYGIMAVCGDLIGLLDDVDADDAIFVGHDWGASVVWRLALEYPERVRAVAGLSVPATRRPPAPPLQILRSRLTDDFYMCWFQEPGVADTVLAADVRRTLLQDDVISARRMVSQSGAEMPTPPWLSDAELNYYLDTFSKTGFTGGLNYYRNLDRDWELSAHLDGKRIDQPSLFIAGARDPVIQFTRTDRLPAMLTDLRASLILEDAGHWIQQERPNEVNDALIAFAREVCGAGTN
ncbi:alpha/beta fold hydrolase [Hoyosella subflava]|uniref:Epoxide hydrolase EphA n=1 Tax=Hoyosella subflava (strain DSM 45089 / JCM 17490 / NBRC 109087 / DQS3-9A1) TaxID=443218 RepID=F6ES11_HOYSD|nr:alpha/beta hydrolase [Hoyosella subflava]AEF40826.1 Epoxide hydrolase EphA [Hoyosella subflava DQS3-9A1]